MNKDSFEELKEIILQEKKVIKEIIVHMQHIERISDKEDKRMIISQIDSLMNSFRKINNDIPNTLDKISLIKPLHQKINPKTISLPTSQTKTKKPVIYSNNAHKKQLKKITELEKETLKRLKRKEQKTIIEKTRKPSIYVKLSNQFFSNFSKILLDKKMFGTLKKDLVKANLQFVPKSYVSLILFTTLLSFIAGIFVFLFFLFFNFGAELPMITRATEDFYTRFLKVFWILFAIPFGTFLITYFYPSLEKKSAETRINQELPFAAIHMASISNSMIEPSKIFSIIILTKEYHYIEKEFIKLINEINIHGYNLVNALRNRASNSPSSKLAELFNGLATTITSGGDLPNFFDKRAQTLLFEHRIEREKYTRAAETFMDIYISVVIAAPMILMLLLMMMKIGGLGISLSTSMISLFMVLGVFMINIIFLTFLHLKQPSE